MGAVSLASAVIALASLVLLIVIERRLASSATRSRELSRSTPAPERRVVPEEQGWERKLQVVERRLDDILAVMKQVENRLAERAAPASPPSGPLSRPPAALPICAAPVPPPAPAMSEPALPHFFAKVEATPAFSGEARPASSEPASTDSVATQADRARDFGAPTSVLDSDALLADYRQLVASSGRAEISRWIDAHDGRACDVGDGDSLRMLDRDGGALLVLLPLSAEQGLVVPSGRMVANFATSYAEELSVRPVLRGAFELEADSSGMLRLLAPATAQLVDGRWQIARPGRLSGFARA